ncbi:DUF58 domain-containing protein [Shimia litoralis]|uniref:DUF58 domain-containing protein n=1 Tax=Shimia litoralis TaxID=420403 RepID=A0A4U7N959_9RHOB|nr:DUF58 domain-containing protein [Shimia litoralis]TKZ22247.1 DUF58 domain-containing protein [Shimia litoralis]
MITAPDLRTRAETEASRLPPLLAWAEQLAGTVLLGEHGRRRAGLGDDFWQYRPVQPGDSLRLIDWRRSARSDMQFVRQREWQVAQSVLLWVDQSASMRFASDNKLGPKSDTARVLALALSILLIRAGERVGLMGQELPPRRGEGQILRLADAISHTSDEDFGTPETRAMLPHARALFVSDFMGNIDDVEASLLKAADRGVSGVLLQVLDPTEESFPFQGRTVFESMGARVQHETRKASDLREKYIERLSERRDRLRDMCRVTGWQFNSHLTSSPHQAALLWLYRAMEQR